MNKIGIVILPVLLIGVQSYPSSQRYHVKGHSSSGAQLSSLDLQTEYDLVSSKLVQQDREPRDVRFLRLHDPLDCLSQVVCGMNTYPPQKPSVRTSTANDFAFLLKNAVAKLRAQTKPTTTTTTTTVAPVTKRTSTTKAPLDDGEEDEYYDDDDDDDMEYDADDTEDYDYDHDDQPSPGRTRRGKKYSIFSKRRGESKTKTPPKTKDSSKMRKSPVKKSNWKNNQPFKKMIPKQPRPLTPLEKLRMETDLRAKLMSDAQCVNGLQDHSCPFNYQQMLVLISSALERERTISYTTNKVLPMVGYLIKSRNYTGSLHATFSAIEKIDNYTIEADREGKPIDFTHILDEVMNRETGDTGLRIVDTSNDSASTSVWEDDEFDHVLQNPYVRKRPQSDNYKLAEKKKEELRKKQEEVLKQILKPKTQKGSATTDSVEEQTADNDQSMTSEEDTSEEGLIFDRPRPQSSDSPNGPRESSSEEDEVNQEDNATMEEKDKKKKKKKITGTGFGGKKSMVPGPVFGFSHLQKKAEDE